MRGASLLALVSVTLLGIVGAPWLIELFAGGLRFWHLGQPNELVFDEVYFVEQGKNYLRGKEFMDPHPPLAKRPAVFLLGRD